MMPKEAQHIYILGSTNWHSFSQKELEVEASFNKSLLTNLPAKQTKAKEKLSNWSKGN